MIYLTKKKKEQQVEVFGQNSLYPCRR